MGHSLKITAWMGVQIVGPNSPKPIKYPTLRYATQSNIG